MSEIENLQKEAMKILDAVNVKEILDISSDLFLVAEWIESSEKGLPDEVFNEIKLETAFILSLFAEKHSPSLNKIINQFPDFWLRVQNYRKHKKEYEELIDG